MKKTILALLSIAAVAAAACQPKEATEAVPQGRCVPVTLTALQPGATRTFIEKTAEGWAPKWQQGDLLTVTYLKDGDYEAQKSFVLICSLLRIQKKKNCTSEGSYSYAEEEHIP